MTQTLSAGAIWTLARDKEEATLSTAEMPKKTGYLSFTKGESYFLCMGVEPHLGRWIVLHEPQISGLEETFQPRSGGFIRIRTQYGEFTYSEAHYVFSTHGLPTIWSSMHWSFSRMAMLQLNRISKATKLMSSRLRFEPRSNFLTPKPWFLAFILLLSHSLASQIFIEHVLWARTVLGTLDTTMNKQIR